MVPIYEPVSASHFPLPSSDSDAGEKSIYTSRSILRQLGLAGALVKEVILILVEKLGIITADPGVFVVDPGLSKVLGQ